MTQVSSISVPMAYGRTVRPAAAQSKAQPAAQATQTAQAPKAQVAAQSSASIDQLIDAYDDTQKVYAQQMKRWFQSSPGMILFMNASPFMRSISSWLTGVPKEALKEFAYRADLMRVPGMDAATVRTLRNPIVRNFADIKGPADLGNSSIGSIINLLSMLGAGGDISKANQVIQSARGMQNRVS